MRASCSATGSRLPMSEKSPDLPWPRHRSWSIGCRVRNAEADGQAGEQAARAAESSSARLAGRRDRRPGGLAAGAGTVGTKPRADKDPRVKAGSTLGPRSQGPVANRHLCSPNDRGVYSQADGVFTVLPDCGPHRISQQAGKRGQRESAPVSNKAHHSISGVSAAVNGVMGADRPGSHLFPSISPAQTPRPHGTLWVVRRSGFAAAAARGRRPMTTRRRGHRVTLCIGAKWGNANACNDLRCAK